MQSRKEKYGKKYIDIGVCDERGAVFHATAVKLPGLNSACACLL